MTLTKKLKNILKSNPTTLTLLNKIYHSVKLLKNHPSIFSIIKKVWSARAPFIAPVNSVTLSNTIPSQNLAPQGRCYFVPFLFKTSGLDSLLELILRRNYKRLAIIGDSPLQKKLITVIQNRFPELNTHSFTNSDILIQTFDTQSYEAAILTAYNENAISLIRTVLNTLQFPGDLIIEGQAHSVVSIHAIESAKPIVVCAYPCAGTNRFLFGFAYLMNKLKWETSSFSPFVRNIRYIHTLKQTSQKKPDDELIDNAFYWKIQTLDYFQWLTTHEYFLLSKVKDLDCRFVVLMRDPRDIINSFYWHTINEVPDKENHIHRIIDGYSRFAFSNYACNWPNINKIMDNYLAALESDNCYVVRFEDLHQDDISTFRRLMNQLKLYPHPLIEISEHDLQHAAYLGSFEYQTGGKLKRGQFNLGRPGGEHSGVSCRKGIVGDWRSSFTPEAVKHFKNLTGDRLIKLGYEKDLNW